METKCKYCGQLEGAVSRCWACPRVPLPWGESAPASTPAPPNIRPIPMSVPAAAPAACPGCGFLSAYEDMCSYCGRIGSTDKDCVTKYTAEPPPGMAQWLPDTPQVFGPGRSQPRQLLSGVRVTDDWLAAVERYIVKCY